MGAESRRVIVEQTASKADEFAAGVLKAVICESVGERGVCSVALAGGTTPRPLYQSLAAYTAPEEVPWRAVEVFFGDERDVPHDHIDSNYGMAQRTLLDHLPIEPARVHPMPADADDLDAAARRYEEIVRQCVPAGSLGLPQLDLILLGMGSDGHTASLFPGTDAVSETKRLIVAHYVPVLGRRRMTVTFPLINAARNVLLLVTGEDKAQAVAAMLGEDSAARSELPAARVDPKHGKLFIVLDAAAARLAYAGT